MEISSYRPKHSNFKILDFIQTVILYATFPQKFSVTKYKNFFFNIILTLF